MNFIEERLIHDNEKSYYTLCLIISILTYLGLILSVVGIFYILVGVLVSVFLHGLAIGHIRNNGVKLTERQFPEINARAKEIAINMGVNDLPDIYIIQEGGILNAFATRFFGRNFIVLYSEVAELIKDGSRPELDFIIAHELAHIKRKHITKHMFILPALWVPFLGNAYSRACEYTCDRIAVAQINNDVAATNALAILAIGKKLYIEMNIEEYIETAKTETGLFVWLSSVLSTHPPLPKRIAEIQYWGKMIKGYNLSKIG